MLTDILVLGISVQWLGILQTKIVAKVSLQQLVWLGVLQLLCAMMVSGKKTSLFDKYEYNKHRWLS